MIFFTIIIFQKADFQIDNFEFFKKFSIIVFKIFNF